MNHFFKSIIIFITLIGSFFNAPLTHASTQDFSFKSFVGDYYLTKDNDGVSHLKVVETLVAQFPEYDQNHGITRVIPFTNQGGKNLTVPDPKHLDITVTRNGTSEPIHNIKSEDGAFIINIGSPDSYVHGEQTYVLNYSFEKVITSYAETNHLQELYWDANGNGWHQSFGSVTANLHIPDSNLLKKLQKSTSCYVGKFGEKGTTRCEITPIADGISFTAKDLLASENLSFDIAFPADTFVIPAPQEDYTLIILGIAVILLTGASIFISYRAKSKIAKKFSFTKKRFVAPQYTPHKNFTVAEMSEIYLKPTNLPHVATLLELAVNHKIELVKNSKSSKDWSVHIKTLDGISKDQLALLTFLSRNKDLTPDTTFPLTSTSSTSASTLALRQNYSKSIEASLTDKKAYETTPSTTSFLLPILGWITILGIFYFFITKDNYKILVAEWASPLIPIACFIGIFKLAKISSKISNISKRTMLGLELSNYMDGLKRYIQMAETSRLSFLQSVDGADTSTSGIVKLYEKLLPYAAIFGLEKTWLKELQRYYDEDSDLAPDWCMGALSAVALDDFAKSMNTLVSSVSTISSVSSSSSSGSSGGGFSGGGGGGGGGGGW